MALWTSSFWIVVCMILVILEILLPGEFFIWFAISALATSVVAGLGLGWQWQVTAFAVGSLLAISMFFRRLKHRITTPQKVNDWHRRLLGKTGQAVEHIPAGGTGNVAVAGTLWLVQAKTDIAKGQAVTVIGFKENLPVVEAGDQPIKKSTPGD